MYELIDKAKKGDKEAFTDLILLLEKDLYRIARARLSNDNDIADCMQETMLIAFKSIKKLKDNKYFKTWIIRILINNCNDFYRKKKILEFEELKAETQSQVSDIRNLEEELDFEYIIKNLNYDEKIALTLYYMEEYTTKEISDILKQKETTIKVRISRAKNKLREINQGGKEKWMI